MVKSMTGYGRDVISFDETTITVEIRSVNHRFLDFSAKMPRSLLFLEDKIKRIIQSYFHRGRLEVFLNIDGNSLVEKELLTDSNLMDQYIEEIRRAKSRYDLSGEIPITIISNFLDLFSVHEKENQPDDLNDLIVAGTKRACERVRSMRQEEGRFLLEDLNTRMERIRETVQQLQTRREYVIREYRERVQARIDNYIGENAIIDEARMHQEIALLAEKGDITEEITRLLSHIDHFSETIEMQEAIGRKLDFNIQEMHREANTIGSKSTDAKISEWIVKLKSDIEKMKEQIQNIE
ncbi:YicC/YloC family endoribonuclease [Virgibacillus doumboii]|uniref:YicC/YloC family endoribonuclease n=1 Tax=Virgibacillus doumboii TaxID=2697503 RepID=UPI0013DF542B|nr:YicC/YloC family endoribonuclease [Virgibacillus doumboii]